jgi:hypothetical protein
MKVRIIKTPKFPFGGVYDRYTLSPNEAIGSNTYEGIGNLAKLTGAIAGDKSKIGRAANKTSDFILGENYSEPKPTPVPVKNSTYEPYVSVGPNPKTASSWGSPYINPNYSTKPANPGRTTTSSSWNSSHTNPTTTWSTTTTVPGTAPTNTSTPVPTSTTNASMTPSNSTPQYWNPNSWQSGPPAASTVNNRIIPFINQYGGDIQQFKDGGKWIQNAVNPSHKGYCTPMSKSTCTPHRKALARTFKKHHGFHQDGGASEPMDPQLLEAYSTITSQLQNGADPDSIIGEFVSQGMSYDDAQHLLNQIQFPKAQMGGAAQPGMNAGMFAGQSQQPFVIKKPLMKEGGQTFVTSQQGYTAKSHNYFGTSNAPARDSYVDNDQITTSVKPVPEEDATIEAEKGEYIFSKGGLYKILGKKHTEGGTPLAAKGGEFIFSAHKDMSLDPNLQKEAGLKVHSSKSLAEHTPAKVLERNIDPKEYNRLKSILENPKSDPITKKTAQFMLDKMDSKLQVISSLQEAKKQPAQVEVQDQYLEQGDVQGDINQQKQFAYGGRNLPKYQTEGPVNQIAGPVSGTTTVVTAPGTVETTTTTPGTSETGSLYQGYEAAPNTPDNLSQVGQFQKGLDELGYTGAPITGLGDYNQKHDEILKAQQWVAKNYPNEIRNYLGTVKPSNAVKTMLHGRPLSQATDEEIGKGYADAYFSYRGFLPKKRVTPPNITKTITTSGSTGSSYDEGGNEETSQYIPPPRGIPDPYNKIKGMQLSQYMNNLNSNVPLFTYAPPKIQPLTEFHKMSRQPFENQAASARYSNNQLASKSGDRTASQVAAAGQQGDTYGNLYKVEEFNTQGENQNYNNNLLRNSAAVNQFALDVKQAHDLNNNVLDKYNYANAVYGNQYSTARQKDMLNKHYADVDLQTSMLPYIDQNYQMPVDLRTKGMNPNWRGWNTNAVNSMANRQNDFDTRISQYNKIKTALGGREPTEKEIQYFSSNNNK